MRHFLHTIIIASALTLAHTAAAEPTVNRHYQHYDVTGHDIQALRYAISTRGPQAPSGKRFAAHTDYDIRWNYDFAKLTDGHCAINAAHVTVNINYRMPKLVGSSLMPGRVNRQWQRYSHALHQHEEGHAQLGIQAAHNIEKTLPTLRAQKDCSTMKTMANHAATDIVKRYHLKNLEYDRHTNHGHRQGAILAAVE